MKLKKVLFIVLAFFMMASCAMPAHAYTEEEKAQAKAWLSAHGYSPDMAGASQAYQDYLDGKFDEELGITSNSQEEVINGEQSSTEELTTEEKKPDKKQRPGSVKNKKNSVEIQTSVRDTENPGKEDGKGNVSVEEQSEQKSDTDTTISDNQKEVIEEEQTTEILANGEESKKTIIEIAPLRKNKYKSAAIVIGISVVVMLLTGGLVSLKRRKK